MDKQSLHETAKRLALELHFVELCWPFGPEFDVFKIGGKIFMLSSELRGVPFINLKSDPQKSLLNQQIYPSIKPGYHMNKKHWISVYPGEDQTFIKNTDDNKTYAMNVGVEITPALLNELHGVIGADRIKVI